jgi:hypothetical protein
MTYFFYSLFLSLVSFLSIIRIHSKYKYILLVLVVILCSLFVGLRYEVGSDYWNYYDQYINAVEYGWDMWFEPGFILSVIISNFLVDSYFFYTLLYAFISISILAYALPKVTPFWLLSFILILLSQMGSFTGSIRTGFVFGILIFATVYIKKQQSYKFLFTVLLAASIHYASLIFLLSYLFRKIELSRLIYLFIFLSSIIIGILGVFQHIMNFILEIIAQNNSLFGVYANKLNSYTQAHLYGGIGLTSVVKKSILFGYFLYFYSTLKIRFKMYNIYFNIVLFGYILYFIITPSFPVLGARISLWFTFFELILLPLPLLVVKALHKKILIILFSLFVSIATMVQTIFSYEELYLPYKTYLGVIF